MTMTNTSFEQMLTESKAAVVTLHLPRTPGAPWQVTIRKDSGWTVGDYKPTMEEAARDAIKKFGGWKDELEDLLG